MKDNNDSSAIRLDKWLWAARFFKTRSLAQKHIELGRVQVNGSKVKNSKSVGIGDIIELTLNSLPYKIEVKGLNNQRRQLDEFSRISHAYPDGRPTKRDRRQLDKMKKGSW